MTEEEKKEQDDVAFVKYSYAKMKIPMSPRLFAMNDTGDMNDRLRSRYTMDSGDVAEGLEDDTQQVSCTTGVYPTIVPRTRSSSKWYASSRWC